LKEEAGEMWWRFAAFDLSRGFASVAAATKCEGFQPGSAAAAIGAAGAVE
jgi:hypothetical protein